MIMDDAIQLKIYAEHATRCGLWDWVCVLVFQGYAVPHIIQRYLSNITHRHQDLFVIS